uniref:Uncharacterized protein n=1 Tax=Anguilla anguilla TaxID=7936 RepID=A0A0E9QD64_ANGAN
MGSAINIFMIICFAMYIFLHVIYFHSQFLPFTDFYVRFFFLRLSNLILQK